MSSSVHVLVLCILAAPTPLFAEPLKKAPLTVEEVNAAQQAWCDGLVKIGKVHAAGGDYMAVASQLIDDLYDYQEGKVFFRPTLAVGKNTFRNTKAGALLFRRREQGLSGRLRLRPEALGEGRIRQQRRRERHSDSWRGRPYHGERLSYRQQGQRDQGGQDLRLSAVF